MKMIKIIKDRLDKREEIFSAVCEKVDVSATVKEIIENVNRALMDLEEES